MALRRPRPSSTSIGKLNRSISLSLLDKLWAQLSFVTMFLHSLCCNRAKEDPFMDQSNRSSSNDMINLIVLHSLSIMKSCQLNATTLAGHSWPWQINHPGHSMSAVHMHNLAIVQSTARQHQLLHNILSDSNSTWSYGWMPRSYLQKYPITSNITRQAHQLMRNRMVTFQQMTRKMMTIQSTNSLKQANVICTHLIPIVPKHDHSHMMNYVWDRSFSISDGHQPKIKSPHFSLKAHTWCLVVST
jgi:hypothetical protein